MKRLTLSLFAALVLIASCTKNEVKQITEEGTPVSFSFAISKLTSLSSGESTSAKSSSAEIATKASTIDENALSNLWVLQYNGIEESSTLVAYQYLSSVPDLTDVQFSLTDSESATHKVFFIANTFNSTLFTEANKASLAGTIALLRANKLTFDGTFSGSEGLKDDRLLMTGEYTGIVSGASPSPVSTIVLYRMYAKVNFTYTVDMSFGDLQVQSVKIKNAPGYTNAVIDPFSTTAVTPDSFVDVTMDSGASSISDKSGTAVFYMPQSIRGVASGNAISSDKDGNDITSPAYLEITSKGQILGYSAPVQVVNRVYLGADPVHSYNVNANTIYNISFAYEAINTGDTRVEVSALDDETANCYVIKANGSVNIPVYRVNLADFVPYTRLGSTDKWEAKILWQTNATGGYSSTSGAGVIVDLSNAKGTGATLDKYFTVTAHSGITEGNAVVALYKADSDGNATGDILWTWHIWVTAAADGINAGTQGMTYASGAFVLDRAIGASSATPADGQKTFGFYYQWGRKDPFPMASSATLGTTTAVTCYLADGNTEYTFGNLPISSTDGNVAYTVKTPTTFITNNSSTYDWILTSNKKLWSSTKTIYDPCPIGWIVPANGTWDDFDDTNPSLFVWSSNPAGGTYTYNSNTAWYPASGHLHKHNGHFIFVGTGGYFWSVGGTNTNSFNLDFTSVRIITSYESSRAHGLPIRCAKI